MNASQHHYDALVHRLFSSSDETPRWLKVVVRDCQYRYGDIGLTDQFKAAINAFDESQDTKPFELFVVGEGKFGKSTLVNCLLGEERSEVRGLPTTRHFLRYVVADQPTNNVKLYVRAQPGIHDWLSDQLGPGSPVKELFQVHKHEVDGHTARLLLEEEISRLNRGSYDPAIFEAEREVKRSRISAFSNNIRVVDTQGLDQLFPEELRNSVKNMSSDSSKKRFMDWMNESPRGKHLEWQFRRCDSVLWCINSKRLGSMATDTALEYFSRYSKRIVIALTHFDSARSERDQKRTMNRAEQIYKKYAARIIPVNGLAAWEALKSEDEETLQRTGFNDLAQVLTQICEVEGTTVRNKARYTGIRRTESQFRQALSSLSEDYGTLIAKYKQDLKRVKQSKNEAWAAMKLLIESRSSDYVKDVLKSIPEITTKDTAVDIEMKLGLYTKTSKIEALVQTKLETSISSQLMNEVKETTPYELPSFDADGSRAGTSVSVSPDIKSVTVNAGFQMFYFRLSGWDKYLDTVDSIVGGVGGIFSKTVRDVTAARIRRRIELRHEHIKQSFLSDWENFEGNIHRSAKKEVKRQFNSLTEAIELAFEKIEFYTDGSISGEKHRIDRALEGISVGPVFKTQLLKSLEAA